MLLLENLSSPVKNIMSMTLYLYKLHPKICLPGNIIVQYISMLQEDINVIISLPRRGGRRGGDTFISNDDMKFFLALFFSLL